jgi:hypothetical protein
LGEYFAIQANPTVALLVGLFLFDVDDLEAEGVKNAKFLSKQVHTALTTLALEQKDPAKETALIQSMIRDGSFKIGNSDFSDDFKKALTDYIPIWKKHSKAMVNKAEKIPTAYKRCNVDYWLPRIKTFFGSGLSPCSEEPFEIFLFPILKNNYGFSLPPRFIFIQMAPYDEVVHVGIIIHECCHLFYKAMQGGQRQLIEEFFKRNNSVYAILAKNYLDEALATCIGNRLIVNQVNTEYSEKSYDNKYIEKYSEVLLSLVKEYLENNRTMDESFLKKAVHLFEQTFPDSPNDYEALLFSASIFSDYPNDSLAESGLAELMQNTFSCGEIQVFPLEKRNSKPPVLRSADIFLLKNFTDINGITLNKCKDYLHVKKANGKVRIVIQTDSTEKAAKAIAFLKEQGYFKCGFLYNL